MRRLRHTLPLGAGETPASFASRIAALNGLSGRQFCMDMGTTFQKVVDGEPQALGIIALKSGADLETLTENAFVKMAERRYAHRRQEFTRDNLRRATVVVCPMCLAEDIAAAPRSRPQVVAFQRARWQIGAMKTCTIHLAPLVVVDKDMTPSTLHDWSHHASKVLPELPRLVAEAGTRPLTGFECYVLNRTNGGSIRGGWIDTLPLYVAIVACELFGAVAAFGRTPNLNTLTDEEWRLAGAAGFDIVGDGKPGIEVFLEDLQATYPYSRSGNEGPQAVFGRIYQSLEFYRDGDSAYDPLRDLVGNFVRKNFPVGPGDVVFGKPVEKRVLHSIRTLSLETGLHPKRLRKVLKASGVLPDGSADLADANCLFDAQRALMVGSEASAAPLTVLHAGEYINAPRVQRTLLYRAGILKPRVKTAGHGAYDMFAPEDLDAFLDRLLGGATPVAAASDGQGTIPEAAKRACCGAEAIVRLVLDGRLARKWKLAGERGYMSLLVDLEEIRALVRGADHGGFTGRALAQRLGVADRVTPKLIAGGHLKTETVVNPINRCPTVIVTAEEVERFESEYVSLFVLAKQQGRHFRAVKKEIEAAGVKPAFDPKEIGATFYPRSELNRKICSRA